MLRGAGVEAPVRLLGPLLTAALDNVLRLGDDALTGPVARGDVGTVERAPAALRREAPASLPAYVAMARRTADARRRRRAARARSRRRRPRGRLDAGPSAG